MGGVEVGSRGTSSEMRPLLSVVTVGAACRFCRTVSSSPRMPETSRFASFTAARSSSRPKSTAVSWAFADCWSCCIEQPSTICRTLRPSDRMKRTLSQFCRRMPVSVRCRIEPRFWLTECVWVMTFNTMVGSTSRPDSPACCSSFWATKGTLAQGLAKGAVARHMDLTRLFQTGTQLQELRLGLGDVLLRLGPHPLALCVESQIAQHRLDHVVDPPEPWLL